MAFGRSDAVLHKPSREGGRSTSRQAFERTDITHEDKHDAFNVAQFSLVHEFAEIRNRWPFYAWKLLWRWSLQFLVIFFVSCCRVTRWSTLSINGLAWTTWVIGLQLVLSLFTSWFELVLSYKTRRNPDENKTSSHGIFQHSQKVSFVLLFLFVGKMLENVWRGHFWRASNWKERIFVVWGRDFVFVKKVTEKNKMWLCSVWSGCAKTTMFFFLFCGMLVLAKRQIWKIFVGFLAVTHVDWHWMVFPSPCFKKKTIQIDSILQDGIAQNHSKETSFHTIIGFWCQLMFRTKNFCSFPACYPRWALRICFSLCTQNPLCDETTCCLVTRESRLHFNIPPVHTLSWGLVLVVAVWKSLCFVINFSFMNFLTSVYYCQGNARFANWRVKSVVAKFSLGYFRSLIFMLYFSMDCILFGGTFLFGNNVDVV